LSKYKGKKLGSFVEQKNVALGFPSDVKLERGGITSGVKRISRSKAMKKKKRTQVPPVLLEPWGRKREKGTARSRER